MGSAGFTQGVSAEVDPFDGVGTGHGTLVVLAVAEIESVAQFVNGFFEEALAEEGIVAIEAVELLAQTVRGDDGAGAAHLGFAENVFQDRNVEVDIGDREKAPSVRTEKRLHAL